MLVASQKSLKSNNFSNVELMIYVMHRYVTYNGV